MNEDMMPERRLMQTRVFSPFKFSNFDIQGLFFQTEAIANSYVD